jgi:adenosylmethionine-8-amino-7-oxononanoate aminotransferase
MPAQRERAGGAEGEGMNNEHETHMFEYRYQGAMYVLHMVADSEEEATERIKAAARHGVYLGVLAGTIPADGPPSLPPNRLKICKE